MTIPHETRVRALGDALLAELAGHTPGIFNKAWWSGQIMERAMRDPAFKTEMFRFVDVFPVLDSPEAIGRHMREYLLRPGLSVPTPIKLLLKGANLSRLAMRVAAGQIAKNLEGMARSFIAGRDPADAVPAVRALRQQGLAFTVDLLGEAVVSEAEAEAFVGRYAALIDALADEAEGWPEAPLLDRDDRGPIPAVNVSIKVSALNSQLDPLDLERSVERAAERLLPLFLRARERGVFVNLDLEHYALKDITLALFKRVMADPRLADFEHAGVVIQAYLRDAEADLAALIQWARTVACRRITVRLVKGAYWDYETVHAHQEGWPSPVWLDKADSDACFERCTTLLLANHAHVRPAIASHNVRSLAFAMATAEANGVPREGYEIQCLYGMAEPIKAACAASGHRVRVYAPVGELIPGMAYLVRRLLENTSNEGWLRQGFAEQVDADRLLAAPVAVGREPFLRPQPLARTPVDSPPPFVNEPLRELRRPAPRAAFAAALQAVSRGLGEAWRPLIDGAAVSTGDVVPSLDPADGQTVIGAVHQAGVGHVDTALAVAQAAWPAWRDRPWRDRVAVLFEAAARLRADRDAWAALLVREVGKPWREADGEVCEAIDFCEYYGRLALKLGAPTALQPDLPGELNHLLYEGRGVAAVIAPWNFPLAILAGMTVAALVTGNAVIMKPAEQSAVVGLKLAQLLLDAGAPPGVLQCLPGPGETVGAHLVAHRAVHTVAFTGSQAVGLAIWRQAGITGPGQARLKRVVCEMGGKNAIIVDDDADLDEAVLGVVQSAFGYAGQKCSACSRVIVLDGQHDDFVRRLVAATASLQVGAPRDPGVAVGPVIDAESHERLQRVIAQAQSRARLRVGGVAQGPGWCVTPAVFDEVAADDPLATEELFGPVLAVLRAHSLDEALQIAVEGTPYALTGGLYSRSPSHIEQARAAFRVGNLYINRPITGALVGRQPFGGFGMSGGGTKAGGPDYLLAFVDARVVTENALRRGFAPEQPAS